MRALIRHGVTRDLAALLLQDIRRALDYFARNPVSHPMSEADGGSFNHGGKAT
jgi:glutamate decarboxylase